MRGETPILPIEPPKNTKHPVAGLAEKIKAKVYANEDDFYPNFKLHMILFFCFYIFFLISQIFLTS